MRYKNNKTGVTIDVTSEIYGGDWELVETEETKEQESEEVTQEETETPDVETQKEEEYVEEEVDLEDMTNDQLEEFAEEHGIKLTTKDKKNKDARIAAIVAAFE